MASPRYRSGASTSILVSGMHPKQERRARSANKWRRDVIFLGEEDSSTIKRIKNGNRFNQLESRIRSLFFSLFEYAPRHATHPSFSPRNRNPLLHLLATRRFCLLTDYSMKGRILESKIVIVRPRIL